MKIMRVKGGYVETGREHVLACMFVYLKKKKGRERGERCK
jgi:hypothetical protein